MPEQTKYGVERLSDKTWRYWAEFPDGTGLEGRQSFKWPAILTCRDAIRARGFEPPHEYDVVRIPASQREGGE